jgi:hypothetical protein
MSAIGGSITEVTLNGRLFAVSADSEANRKLGGFENEVLANGDGTARIIKTRVPLNIDGLTLECDDSRGDQEFLQQLADTNAFFAGTISYASGLTYQGTMQIVSEMTSSSQSATATVTLAGSGKLTRQ